MVPCYNCISTLDRTVDSLLNQKLSTASPTINYQIVLVNDGSTDSTPQKCNEYADKYPNISVIHKTNGGLVDAWKTGVKNAKGTYIAFCDSDDYIDQDYVDAIINVINQHHPDMIVYGMTVEYDNGETIRSDVLLEEGFYDKQRIDSHILPILLSNGNMETTLIKPSRCNKVFIKQLLDRIVDDVPQNISMGEDEVTSFAAAINMDSIYCIKGYYPYHYIRNTESMIGAYDEGTFDKIGLIYKTLKAISVKYDYAYSDQVEKEILSIMFLYMKKEICKNPSGMRVVLKKLASICETDAFKRCLEAGTIENYSLSKKIFAGCICRKWYILAYSMTKIYEGIRGRKV